MKHRSIFSVVWGGPPACRFAESPDSAPCRIRVAQEPGSGPENDGRDQRDQRDQKGCRVRIAQEPGSGGAPLACVAVDADGDAGPGHARSNRHRGDAGRRHDRCCRHHGKSGAGCPESGFGQLPIFRRDPDQGGQASADDPPRSEDGRDSSGLEREPAADEPTEPGRESVSPRIADGQT
jgi:hypothetical protein